MLKYGGDGKTVTVSSREPEDVIVENKVEVESHAGSSVPASDTPTSGSLHVHTLTRQVRAMTKQTLHLNDELLKFCCRLFTRF